MTHELVFRSFEMRQPIFFSFLRSIGTARPFSIAKIQSSTPFLNQNLIPLKKVPL